MKAWRKYPCFSVDGVFFYPHWVCMCVCWRPPSWVFLTGHVECMTKRNVYMTGVSKRQIFDSMCLCLNIYGERERLVDLYIYALFIVPNMCLMLMSCAQRDTQTIFVHLIVCIYGCVLSFQASILIGGFFNVFCTKSLLKERNPCKQLGTCCKNGCSWLHGFILE